MKEMIVTIKDALLNCIENGQDYPREPQALCEELVEHGALDEVNGETLVAAELVLNSFALAEKIYKTAMDGDGTDRKSGLHN